MVTDAAAVVCAVHFAHAGWELSANQAVSRPCTTFASVLFAWPATDQLAGFAWSWQFRS